ncbi:hypothetical protein V8E36_002602 [Tilletia maclaganii]
MSTSKIKGILMSYRLLGVPDVPSYDQYRASIIELRDRLGSKIAERAGKDGHTIHTKSLARGLQSDFANPLIRPKLQQYPRRGAEIRSYQDAEKAGEHPKCRASMIELGPGRHAYVEEVVQHTNGYALIERWFEAGDGSMHAQARDVALNGPSFFVLDDHVNLAVKDILKTMPELETEVSAVKVIKDGTLQCMLNPLRNAAQGRMVYNIPLFAFIDDLSGNRSKRWNKHLACSVQNAAICAEALGADATIRLFAATDDGTAQELTEALVNELEGLQARGVVCWDTVREETVLVYAHLAAIIADNPQAAELASNIGMKGNYPCRTCEAGGTAGDRATAEGLVKLTQPGPARTIDGLKRSLALQIQKAGSGVVGAWSLEASRLGVKDKLTSSVCERLVEEYKTRMTDEDADKTEALDEVGIVRSAILDDGRIWNPLFRLEGVTGFDVTRDIPCEILHTILLGPVKYLARRTLKHMTAEDKTKLAQWLSAASTVGISDGERLRGSYMIKHIQSLVGKDFRRLAQTMHWALQQVKVDEPVRAAWKALGELAAAMYSPVLYRGTMDEWKLHLRSTLQQFHLECAAVIPDALSNRPKMHLLCHAISDMERFGPLPNVSAERFESFNAIVREASVHSNRRNPSRDIARRVGDEEIIRDLISGAAYFDYKEKTLRQAGPGVRAMLQTDDALRKHVREAYGLGRLDSTRKPTPTGAYDAKARAVKVASGDWIEEQDIVLVRNAIMATDVGAENEEGNPQPTSRGLRRCTGICPRTLCGWR